MLLQGVILPDGGQPQGLYHNGTTVLAEGETLSLDTFYNCFSYPRYREYTNVRKVCFSCRFTGMARVELCVFDGSEAVVSSGDFSGAAELSADISVLPERGFLFPRITALSECRFISGGYFSDIQPRSISCCIAVCTFRREDYVRKNIALLKSFRFSYIDRLFVIDNGGTLDSLSLSDSFVSVLANKNHGGSGGFTRGLIEAQDGGFSHVIFMDDDVEFHPETLEQMTVFVALLSDKHRNDWLSSAMIPLGTPWVQYELGAFWDGKKACINNSGLDMRKRESILLNMNKPKINYGGWWTLCMPVSVTENGYPFPFFIKFDDVEYGLRMHEAEIITMNGIAVRHEAFDLKTSFVLDYYNLRNQLIVGSLYGRSAISAVRLFLKFALKQLVLYRYDNMKIVIRAAKDFLTGVDFFLSNDAEALNTNLINSVIQLVQLEDIPQWREDMRCDEHIKQPGITPAMALTGAGHLIPFFMLKGDVSAVPLSCAGAGDMFRRRTVIQYQLGGQKGICTSRNITKFLKYGFAALWRSLVLMLRYGRVSCDYRSRRNEITDRDFWNRDLGL